MKATLPAAPADIRNGRNYGTEKDLRSTINAVCVRDDGKMCEPVTVRVYGSKRGSRVYCSVWVRDRTFGYTSGSGWAGGGGRHKASAALSAALRAAGIKLDEPIAGHGDSAMRSAVIAVCAALGFGSDRVFLVEN